MTTLHKPPSKTIFMQKNEAVGSYHAELHSYQKQLPELHLSVSTFRRHLQKNTKRLDGSSGFLPYIERVPTKARDNCDKVFFNEKRTFRANFINGTLLPIYKKIAKCSTSVQCWTL